MSLIYDEMLDQFKAMRKTAVYLDGKVQAFKACLEENPDRNVVFLGCGSSYALASSMEIITARYMKRPAKAIAAGDLLLHPNTYAPQFAGALVTVVSRSGYTTEIHKGLQIMADLGLRFSLIVITCTENSDLAAKADTAIEMPWAFDESICQTRTVSCLYFAWCYLVAKSIADNDFLAALMVVARQGEAYLEKWEPVLKRMADENFHHACVMGDAEIAGIAEEGALAFKEICQLPSNYYHVLDSRHGPLVLFNPSTLSVVAASGNSSLEMDYILDVLQKGGPVIVYSDLPLDIDGITNVTFGESLPHAVRGLPLIASIQMLAYYKALAIGIDPENPNGLKSWIKL